PPTGATAATLARDIEIRKQAVRFNVDQSMTRIADDLKGANYPDAHRQLDLARTAVGNERSLFTNDELSASEARLNEAQPNLEAGARSSTSRWSARSTPPKRSASPTTTSSATPPTGPTSARSATPPSAPSAASRKSTRASRHSSTASSPRSTSTATTSSTSSTS